MTRTTLTIGALSLLATSCASFTAIPSTNRPNVDGIRVYAPKAYLVVTGETVSSIIVPDCSKEFAIQSRTFLAKNDLTLEMANGMLTKVESKQDTTAFPVKLIDAVIEATKAGKSLGDAFSTKADGGTVNRFGIAELYCEGKVLKTRSAFAEEDWLRGVETFVPASRVREVPAETVSDDGSKPLQKK